ncbi:glycosyltransferase [Gymnodinialimonas ceratoperidinii]|uniref:Glycosyltransferase n=1 Tax=Gymnodinialimonas ceratoperidinii TaxID=2856823 RepID=A0A8F6TWU3_9RHOB|nr:glycosyltransferase [Gymnodinialimonas ceratoperidinii]QXT39393.1 glycosyltransferase [Gymnodinialimonas ceratoperidinii]
MQVWLTQRAEPTPHDMGERRRPMRTGLMAEYLSTHGAEVLWWTGDYDHYGRRQRGHDNAEIAVSDTYRIRYLAATGYGKTKSLARLRYDRAVAAGFVELAPRQGPPDVILASMPSVDLALASVRYGMAHGIPVIVDIRDLHPDIFVESAPASLGPLVRLATAPMKARVAEICRDATAIWGNSDAFVEWGCSLGGRRRGRHDMTLPIAYKPLTVSDAEKAAIQDAWRREGLFQPDRLHVVFFGTLSKAFDFAPVLEAARRLQAKGSAHHFHFFGAGQQQKFLSEGCASLPNCTMHGPVGAARLQAAMELSDIGLAPYIFTDNFAANMPNKTTEYLGGGLHVGLAFKRGALADFLRRTGSGFCYETAAELTEALTRLQDDPHTLTTAKAASRAAFVQHLGYDTLSTRMHAQLVETVKTFGNRATRTGLPSPAAARL